MSFQFKPATPEELAARGVLPPKADEAKAPAAPAAPAATKATSKPKESKK